MLGTELELRLLSYRDTSPLTGGQVDDEPYGGGAGMVLRVDVVAAALDAVYGGAPGHRVVALTPQGRQLDQPLVEELAGEENLTLLSARFEGFDERVVEHFATDAISIGPYVLSGGELPAMVLVDAIARRLPGALGSEESGLEESFSAELEGGLEYPHYTRPAEFRGWEVPEVLLSGDHARIAEWRREQSRARTVAEKSDRPPDARLAAPVADRHRLGGHDPRRGRDRARDQGVRGQSVPHPVLVDGADLHCARPGNGCEARFSDRVLANRFIYHFRDPKRGEIVVFKTPPAAQVACSGVVGGTGGDTFVKRLVGLPGDRWREQDGFIYINGEKLDEPYVKPERRDADTIPEKTIPKGEYLMLGDNRSSSCDSRRWGTVPRDNLIGPVFAIYWPPGRFGFR